MNTRPMPPSSVPMTAVRISSSEEFGVIAAARADQVHRQRDEHPGDGRGDAVGAACADAVQFSQLGVVGDRDQELAFLAEAQEQLQGRPALPRRYRQPADPSR